MSTPGFLEYHCKDYYAEMLFQPDGHTTGDDIDTVWCLQLSVITASEMIYVSQIAQLPWLKITLDPVIREVMENSGFKCMNHFLDM